MGRIRGAEFLVGVVVFPLLLNFSSLARLPALIPPLRDFFSCLLDKYVLRFAVQLLNQVRCGFFSVKNTDTLQRPFAMVLGFRDGLKLDETFNGDKGFGRSSAQ